MKLIAGIKKVGGKIYRGFMCFYHVINNFTLKIFAHFKTLPMHLRAAISAGIAIIFLILIMLIVSHHGKKTDLEKAKQLNMTASQVVSASKKIGDASSTASHGIGEDLTDLQAKLANIEKMMSDKQSVVNMDQVRSGMSNLGQEISHIQQANQQQYGELKSQINDLGTQLVSLQKSTSTKLNEIEAVSTKKACLDAKHLPFTVQSIDLVNSRGVVSVMYSNMVSPLEKDFSLAGWKLSESNYEKQTARFVNNKGICVEVNLNNNF